MSTHCRSGTPSGNGGCYGSKGTLAVEIDGVRLWEGHEYDSGWKHCGWTYRANVPVDWINGRVVTSQVVVDSCYNVGDCDD